MENKNNQQDKKKQLVVGVLIVAIIVVIAFVIVVLSVQPWYNATPLLEGSLFYKLLAGLVRVPTEYFRGISA